MMYYIKDEIKQQLRQIGLRSGMNIILQAEGDFTHIVGQEKTIIDAIIEIIGYEGNLLIPSFTPDCSSVYAKDIELTIDEMEKIKYAQEAFDLKKSLPSNRFAQQFLIYDDTLRSNHPLYSCIAWGKYAPAIIRKHPLHFGLGNNSPINKMYDFHAYILTINTEKNVFFDFVANSTNKLPIKIMSAPITTKESKINKELLDYELDISLYPKIKKILEQEDLLTTTKIASYQANLCSMVKTFPLVQMLLTKTLLEK